MRRDRAAEARAIVERLCVQFADLLAQIPEAGPMSGAIYLRISEDRMDDELAIERQFSAQLELFRVRGFSLDRRHIFIDNDQSAKIANTRIEFRRMLEVVVQGRLKVVGARDMYRLTRNRRDQLALFEAAEQCKLLLVFQRGADLDMGSPHGQTVADILAAVARGEVQASGDRQNDRNRQAAERGDPPSGPVPLGFNDDRVTHDEVRASAVRQAYEDILAGGTLAGIARRLNEAGFRSGKIRWARGHEGEESLWSPESVRQMLLAPRNAGFREYKGEIVGKGQWMPIVPEETWRAAVAVIKDPSRTTRKPVPRYLLSGVAKCACGEFVVSGRAYKHGHTYRCGLRDKKAFRATPGGEAFVHAARRGDQIDQWIGLLVTERLARDDAVDLLLKPVDGPTVAELYAKRDRLRAKLEALTDEWMSDGTNDIEYQRGRKIAREQLAKLNAQIEERGQWDILAPLIYAEDIEKAWEDLVRDRKRPVVEVLFEEIMLLPAGKGAREFNPQTVITKWRERRGQ